MLAWERLHVLARNPIPPASSDNSLSASFPPPSAAFSTHLRFRRSYPGADPRSRPTPSYPSDRCAAARGATSGSICDPALFSSSSLSFSARGDNTGQLLAIFRMHLLISVSLYEGRIEGERERKRWKGTP